MGSNTPLRNYPFPASTDKIAQGAVNIEDLSEAVENSRALATNVKLAADAFSTYPVGHSQMYVSGSGVANGWPSNYGNVITIYTTASNCWQWFYPFAAPNTAAGVPKIRYGDANGWWDWQPTSGGGNLLPLYTAAGAVTVTPDAGLPKAVVITMPSGRFPNSTGMRVQLTAGGATHPEDIALSAYSVNSTQLTVYIWRKTATDTAISWLVQQGGSVA